MRSKNPTPVILAGVDGTLVMNDGICASCPSGGVRNEAGMLNAAMLGMGRSPENEVRGTSIVPPGGRTKSFGDRLWTSLSSTAWRASLMFCNHGESPTNVLVGVGTSPT